MVPQVAPISKQDGSPAGARPVTELEILSPDGRSRTIQLASERFVVGRAPSVDLSYPDDNGLSRQHFCFEKDSATGEWFAADLGSKNGTTLNGARLAERTRLQPGDRLTAGHLILTCGDGTAKPLNPVVVFDPLEASATAGATIISNVRGDSAAATAALAANHISALIRAGNELAGNRPLAELFPFILDLAIKAVAADRGVLLTVDNGELTIRAHRGEGFRISSAVRDRVLNTGASVLVRDTAFDDALRERRSIVEQHIRTLMAVPLQTADQIIGIIYLDSPSLMREFTRDDLNLLTVMANVAAIRIEHTRFAEIERARQLLARDLEQAAEIQRGFLPAGPPAVQGLDVAGHNAPCRTVGGDYYDFFPYENNHLAMVLGDVSGKGMPASLLMMGLQARVQVLIEEPKDLADVMTRLNRITSANCPPNRFITLFFCILNAETGELTFCNAGHNPPLIVRADGSHVQLKGGGPVVGILPFIEYKQFQANLDVGDTLVIYSDGVTEATNPAGDEFDIDGLAAVVAAHRSEPAANIINEVNAALKVYTADAPPADDVTLIVARRVSP